MWLHLPSRISVLFANPQYPSHRCPFPSLCHHLSLSPVATLLPRCCCPCVCSCCCCFFCFFVAVVAAVPSVPPPVPPDFTAPPQWSATPGPRSETKRPSITPLTELHESIAAFHNPRNLSLQVPYFRRVGGTTRSQKSFALCMSDIMYSAASRNTGIVIFLLAVPSPPFPGMVAP